MHVTNSTTYDICLAYSNSVCELVILRIHKPALVIILMYPPPSCPAEAFSDIISRRPALILSIPSPMSSVIILGDFNFYDINWTNPDMSSQYAIPLISLSDCLFLNKPFSEPNRKPNILDRMFSPDDFINSIDVTDSVLSYYNSENFYPVFATLILFANEKIIIKDLPPHIPSDDIIEFLEQKHPHILTRSGAILARIPSRTNTLTEYYSGDRVVYAKEGFFPVLPINGIIKGMPCKFWHANQNIICKICGSDDHRTVDTDKCKSYVSEPSSSVFISDTDPRSNFFVLENKLTVFDREWITSEHPYQWKKMIDNGLMGLADKVAVAPTPREAKAIANSVPNINLNNWDE